MLQDMRKAQCADGIRCRVNIGRRVRHILVTHVSSRVPSRVGARVVAARVATNVVNPGERRIGGDDGAEVGGEWGADVVGVEGDDIVGAEAGHVLVDSSKDLDAVGSVVVHHVAGTKEASFLARVEVEFQRVGWGEPCGRKDAEGVENHDDTGGVVVSSGGLAAGGRSHRVEVG